MMKKLVIGLLGLVSALLLVACGKNSGETSGDNWSTYQSNKSITIGFDSTFVPMGFAQKDPTDLVAHALLPRQLPWSCP